jgi:hypothetical protein
MSTDIQLQYVSVLTHMAKIERVKITRFIKTAFLDWRIFYLSYFK